MRERNVFIRLIMKAAPNLAPNMGREMRGTAPNLAPSRGRVLSLEEISQSVEVETESEAEGLVKRV